MEISSFYWAHGLNKWECKLYALFSQKICKVVIMYSQTQVIEIYSVCAFFIIMSGTNIPPNNDEWMLIYWLTDD